MSIKYLKNKLEKDNFNFEEFKELLIKTNSFIAGSYVVKALLKEHWYEKDIDIYTIPKNEDNKVKLPKKFNKFFITKLGYKYHNKYTENLVMTDNTEVIINLFHPDSIKYPNINILILKNRNDEYYKSDDDNECDNNLSKEEKKDLIKIKKEEKNINNFYKTLVNFDLTASCMGYYPSVKDEIISYDEHSKSDCLNKIININNRYIHKKKYIHSWLDTLKRIFKYMRRGFVLSKETKKIIQNVIINKYIKEKLTNEPKQMYFIDEWNQTIFQNYDINLYTEEKEEYYIIPIIKDNLKVSYKKHQFINELNRLQYMKKHIRLNYKVDKKDIYTPCHIDMIKDIDEKEQDTKEESNTENENEYKTFDMLMSMVIDKNEALEDPDNILISHINKKKYMSIAMDLKFLHTGFFSNNLNLIDSLTSIQLTNIFFRCISTNYKNKKYYTINLFEPYIKLIFHVETGEYGISKAGLVKLDSFLEIYKMRNRIFYLTPLLDNEGKQIRIENTSSYQNSFPNENLNEGNSGNYCQEGTGYDIYTIGICEKPSCKLSNKYLLSEEELINRKDICNPTEEKGKTVLIRRRDPFYEDDDDEVDQAFINFFEMEYREIPEDINLNHYIQTLNGVDLKRKLIYEHIIEKAIENNLLNNEIEIKNDYINAKNIQAGIRYDILTRLEERNNNGSIISKKIIQDIVDIKIANFINHYNSIEEKEEKEEKEDNDLEVFFEIDYDDIDDDYDLCDFITINIDYENKRLTIFQHIIEEAIDKICSAEGMDRDGIEFITQQIGDDILSEINDLINEGEDEGDTIITKRRIEGIVKEKIEYIKKELESSD